MIRYSQNTKQSAFTIVELLIVIVVIAILAAISTVAFTGIQARAITSTYASAVNQWDKAMQAEIALTGRLPTYTPGPICVGKSATDFPAEDGFQAAYCATGSIGSPQAFYWDTFFEAMESDISLPDGELPATAIVGAGSLAVSRGIMLYVPEPPTDNYYKLFWYPKEAGECGIGQPEPTANDIGYPAGTCVVTRHY